MQATQRTDSVEGEHQLNQDEDFIAFTSHTMNEEPLGDLTRDGPKRVKAASNSTDQAYQQERIYAPWMSKATAAIHNPNIRLHNEIVEFSNYIQPTKEDLQKRELAIKQLADRMRAEMPEAKLYPFGSYMTKIYLPNADIDMVVVQANTTKQTLMKAMAKLLQRYPQKYSNLQSISTAKVPIIKFVDIEHGLSFDVSFNKLDGLYQVQEVHKAFKVYPEIRHLIFIFKIFLRQRDLNNTYVGGVGSFLLFCLVLAFVREFKRSIIATKDSEELKSVLLSEYLLKFLEFYGIKFECSRKRILMGDNGRVVDKQYTNDTAFSLISPQGEGHDIGNAAFRIKEVFGIFKNRFQLMTNYQYLPGESVLKYLINPSKKDFSIYRH